MSNYSQLSSRWISNKMILLFIIFNLAVLGLSEAKIISASSEDSDSYKPYNIVFEGDSLTADRAYPNHIISMLNPDADIGVIHEDIMRGDAIREDAIHNVAASGQALYPTMIEDASHQVDTKLLGNNYRNIAVLWAGTNDIFFDPSIDVSALHESIKDWCYGRKAAGFQVIVCTITPRSDQGTPGNFEEDRQAINDMIRSHYFEYADGLADIAANPNIGDADDELDTMYYYDKVHMTELGYAIVANIVKDSIVKLTDP